MNYDLGNAIINGDYNDYEAVTDVTNGATNWQVYKCGDMATAVIDEMLKEEM